MCSGPEPEPRGATLRRLKVRAETQSPQRFRTNPPTPRHPAHHLVILNLFQDNSVEHLNRPI